MSITDNVNKLGFSTYFGIDKIVKDNGRVNIVVGAGSPPIPVSATAVEPHTIGQSVIVNARFSIDNANFYPCGVKIDGAIDGGSAQRQYAECIATSSSTVVTFYVRNGFTAGKTVYVEYLLEALS